MQQVANKKTIGCLVDTTCPQQCPPGTGKIDASSRGPKKLGEIIGLSPDDTAELKRINKLSLTEMQKALPECITSMSKNSHICDNCEQVRNAISEQLPEVAKTLDMLATAEPKSNEQLCLLEQLQNQSNDNTPITIPMTVINPPLVNDLGTRGREYKSGDTVFSFVQDGSAQYMTAESALMRDAAAQSPMDMLAKDGSILSSGIILFCDGCHQFFKEGDTWHGCKHITICDDCRAIIYNT